MMRRLDTRDADFESQFAALGPAGFAAAGGAARGVGLEGDIAGQAADIIEQVRSGGDAALLALTQRFDRVSAEDMADLALTAGDFSAAFERLSQEEKNHLEVARGRIEDYHQRQKDDSWSFTDDLGNELGQRVMPLDRVGVYVPGGQAAYPSTVLMTVIPAKVAGVEDVVMTVPTPDDVRVDLVLGAAHIAGVERGFAIGGAQAVAALAYGTQTVPRVDKIVGPGGAFVAAAKRLVFGQVGIDSIAGPSEILIIADGSTPVDWAVLDLFSQAEHDADAQAILISPDERFLAAVAAGVARQIDSMTRRDIIAESLKARGALIACRDLAEAVAISNRIAPEHLQLCVEEPDALLDDVRHAGAIFVGAYSGEVMGDYVAGPSHVLPTFGTARFSSPLGVYDFQKRSSVIRCSKLGAMALADTAAALADGEGLTAHADAALARSKARNEAS